MQYIVIDGFFFFFFLSQLKLNKGEMEFRISEDATNESLCVVVLKKGQRLADGSWHQVHLVYGQDGASLAVDYRRPEFKNLNYGNIPSLILDDESLIVIGVGYLDSQPGIFFDHYLNIFMSERQDKQKYSQKLRIYIFYFIFIFFSFFCIRFYRLYTRSHHES